MKLGTVFNPFSKRALEHKNIHQKIKEYGFDYVDFSMTDTDSPIYTLPLNEAEKLLLSQKNALESAGLKISQVHGPWRWPAQDNTEELRQERFEKMKHSLWASSVLGCENWVIHPIMPYGVSEKNSSDAQKTYQLNLDFMRRLLNEAIKYDITICLENMPMLDFSLATPKDILHFVKEINHPNFKICLDTGHVSVFEELSVGDSVRELGDYIRALHIHDNFFNMDLHLFPFFGNIDWEDFSKSLKEINFDGVFSLETSTKNLPEELIDEASVLLRKISEYIINSSEK